ncbi:RNA-directed DNA polymerase, eukaryota [Tanacetum coccineum]
MGTYRSKEDDVSRISTLIFVTNFPESFSAKDLFHSCKQYGHVVDTFIPLKRSKGGKRFGFVRFINIFNVERLVNNLCTIWVDRLKLQANIARFNRTPLNDKKVHEKKEVGNYRSVNNAPRKDNGFTDTSNSFAHVVKGCNMSGNAESDSIPAIVLDDECLYSIFLSNSLLGRVKEFASLSNLKLALINEGFVDIHIRYMGELWVLLEFATNIDDLEESCFHSRRLCIFTKSRLNIYESFKIVFRGKMFWIRAKEVTGWIPEIMEESDDEDQSVEDFKGGDPIVHDVGSCGEDSHVEEVPETRFDESFGQKEKLSEDPFEIYSFLNKHKNDKPQGETEKDESLKYPPGFTPNVETEVMGQNEENVESSNGVREQNGIMDENINGREDNSDNMGSKVSDFDSGCLGRFKKSVAPRRVVGSSMNFLSLNVQGLAQKAKKDWVKELCVKYKVNFLVLQESKIECMKLFTDYLAHVSNQWDGEVMMMGDFNEVRYKSDRFGSIFNEQGANVFNSFISNAGLEEVPLGGSAFTWCHKSASKMSKLDRFLISENLMNTYPNISAVTLDRYISDHHPILLRESMFDYGPTPFRFYHYWLEVDGFNDFIIETWKVAPGDDSNGMRNMMFKMKFLKSKIQEWNNRSKNNTKGDMARLTGELQVLDADIDNGNGSVEIAYKRMDVINSMLRINKTQAVEVAQKAKIKWSVEGDENSRFFHGMLNKKRSQLSIRGVMVDGMWIEKPNQDCGTDKSPSPDGFTFGFFRHFWSTIEADVFEAVKYFFTNGDIPKGCNSSFIALISKIPDANMVKDFRPISLIGSVYKIIAKILSNRLVGILGDIVNEVQSAFIAERQILDGPFILNEVMQWCTSKKKQALIFKVNFEKAYDSVRWDFLDEVLQKFGFGNKWRMWIQSCLRSSRGSILINGSPTEEFQFFKGLKQGDPLSPFLFILIMESLHLSFQRVVEAGMFTGIKLSSSVTLSLMFYADDAMFLGQWNDGNIDTLVHVLECFYQASGLRINMSKIKIMSVHVEGEKVKQAASKLGCRTLNAPFVYLGTKVGGTMSRVNEWNEVVDKVISRLSKWKMKSLSIGGRLTLLKSVLGSIPIFHMSIFRVPLSLLNSLESIRNKFFNGNGLRSKKVTWIKWSSVLAAQAKGGLGVSSLYALNRGLMLKWVWRFYSQKTALWVRVVKAIHGEDGKVGKTIKSGGAEQSQYDTISDMVREVNLVPMLDRYAWSLESSGEFSVASIRKKIDDNYLPNVSSMTRWVKYVPIKVNILAWKVKMDALPSRFNISRRGIDIESILCPVCECGVESSSHLFFKCSLVRQIVRKISVWWDVAYKDVNSYEEWLTWLVSLRISAKLKMMFEGVFYILWWHIWTYRNKIIFETKAPMKSVIYDDVVSSLFYWCRFRCEKSPNPRGDPREDPRSPLGTGMGMKNDSPIRMGIGMGMMLINGDEDVNTAPSMDFPKMSLKLLVNTKDERVLFAEASKDFVAFIFNIFSIPLGTLIGLLGSEQMVGCLGKLKDSIESFNETYLQHVGSTCSTGTLSSDSDEEDSCDSEEEDHCDSKEEDFSDSAINWHLRNKNVKVASKKGYVKEVVSYMVMDDLVVKPMSTISSITLINNFGIKDLSQLEEKVVEFDKDKVLIPFTKLINDIFSLFY